MSQRISNSRSRLPKALIAFREHLRSLFRVFPSAVLLICAAPFIVSAIFAQVSGYGTINGTVTDPTGAVVGGATVTITNTDTGAKRETAATGSGNYIASDLPAGHYSVTVSHAGFKTTTRTDITLTTSQVAGVNVTLALGQAEQTVTVNASQQMVETTSPALGEVIDSTSITELPLNTRNPGDLVFVTPGAVDGATRGTATQLGYAGSGIMGEVGASVNSGRMGSAYDMLDGVPNMDFWAGSSDPFPNPDATKEFRVLDNNFSAEYGGGSSTIVSVVTKSGTNSWHGDAFEFDRNQIFNAPDWFSKLKDGYTRNIYGASAGGPIRKNKQFIFGNFQQFKSSLQNNGTSTYVPTPAMVNNGDFSGAYPCPGGTCSTQLYYPANFPAYPSLGCSASNPNAGPYSTANPFPCGAHGYGKPITGNNVANDGVNWSKVVDPVAMNILGHIPWQSVTNPTGLDYVPGATVKNTMTEFTTRYDWDPSARSHIMGRVYFDNQNEPAITNSTNLLATDTSWTARNENYVVNWTFTASPTLVNSAYFGADHQTDGELSGINQSWSDVGSTIPEPDPNITVLQGPFGWIQQNVTQSRHDYQVGDQVSWSKGKHLVVAGVNVLEQYALEQASWQADPVVGFSGAETNSNFADFLFGAVSNFNQGGGEYNQYSSPEVAGFVEDTIKLKPNLTVDLGVRWDPWRTQRPHPANRDAVFVQGSCSGNPPVCTDPAQSKVYVNAPPGLLYIGDSGVPAGMYHNDWSRFEPRVGIAWQPGFMPNTSIRAGGGRFALPFYGLYYNHLSANPPFSPTFDLTPTSLPGYTAGQPEAFIPVENPWSVFTPTGGAAPFPNPIPFGYKNGNWNTSPTQTFVEPTSISDIFQTNFKLASVYNWNLSIQHQFGGNLLVSAAYLGSESYDIGEAGDLNPGVFAAGGARTRYGTPNAQCGTDPIVLKMSAVDVGVRGFVRRILKGMVPAQALRSLTNQIPPKLIPWEFVDLIETDPARRVKLKIEHEKLANLHPADIADIVEELSPAEREAVFETLDEEVAAEALEEIEPKLQRSILESLDDDRAADIVEEMDPDAAADLLGDLTDERSDAILEEMEPEQREEVEELLEHHENTAAGRMNSEFLSVPSQASVQEAINALRKYEGDVSSVVTIYLTEYNGSLVGAVPLQNLVLAKPTDKLAQVLAEPLIYCKENARESEFTELFDKYNLMSLPVVNELGKLTGVITADDVIALLRDRQ